MIRPIKRDEVLFDEFVEVRYSLYYRICTTLGSTLEIRENLCECIAHRNRFSKKSNLLTTMSSINVSRYVSYVLYGFKLVQAIFRALFGKIFYDDFLEYDF